MTENDRKVLKALEETSEEWVLPFDPIAHETKLERRVVRLSCRRLARKGLAEYLRGLWSDEGLPAGAGYRITKEGLAALRSSAQ